MPKLKKFLSSQINLTLDFDSQVNLQGGVWDMGKGETISTTDVERDGFFVV